MQLRGALGGSKKSQVKKLINLSYVALLVS